MNVKSRNKIPEDILNNAQLNLSIEKLLPNNYNFEIHKTLARIRLLNAKRIALQLPEGLQLFACFIADILTNFAYENPDGFEVTIMGDVTYGACCIDDYTSRALDCDLLIHYGHSCLVPLDVSKTFYVFVDIKFDTKHFLDTVHANFDPGTHMVLVATVQFNNTLQAVRAELSNTYKVTVPKIAPLTPGEILGCTAPTVDSADCVLYLGDGRFHLEAIMMANPELPAFRYDPYDKRITREHYDHTRMRRNRLEAIDTARNARTFGVILGTLGRQGSSTVLDSVIGIIEARGLNHVTILLSEVFPDKLRMFGDSVDAFIQIACPRLSIDWGTAFAKPLLSPYEAAVALDAARWMPDGHYPMDFYAYGSLGRWTPNHRPTGSDIRHGPAAGKRIRHIVIGKCDSVLTDRQLVQVNTEMTPLQSHVDSVVPSIVSQSGKGGCTQHGWDDCSNCSCVFN